jgi:hypothetical protein
MWVGHVCPKVKENTIKPNRLLLQKRGLQILLKSSNLFIDIPIVAEVEFRSTAGSLLALQVTNP